jgi:diphthine synthase
MLYLIGIGLNKHGISEEALEVLRGCHKVYLENYTVDFPYEQLKGFKGLNKKIKPIGREEVESNLLIKEAKSKKIALLVYGSPLFATTHMSLLLDAKDACVRVKVIYAASIFDALGETGLQLYKFGKITSMPDWKDKGKSDSFMDVVSDNLKIKAHSLILSDIGLGSKRALGQLEEAAKDKKVKLDKIILCSQMGTDYSKIYYDSISKLKKQKVDLPFCIIVPSDLHFLEKQGLKIQTK